VKKNLAFARYFRGLLTVSCGSHCQYQESPLAQPVQRLVPVYVCVPCPFWWNFGNGIGSPRRKMV